MSPKMQGNGRINGVSQDGVPLIKATVELKSDGASADIWFILDTGASKTILCPEDSRSLGLHRIPLPRDRVETVELVTEDGGLDCVPVEVNLQFKPGKAFNGHKREVDAGIFADVGLNGLWKTPVSVLGRDVLQDFVVYVKHDQVWIQAAHKESASPPA